MSADHDIVGKVCGHVDKLVALRTKAETIRTPSGQVTRAGDAVYRARIAVPALQNTEAMTLVSVMKAIPPEYVI
jgi:hypothetical protein